MHLRRRARKHKNTRTNHAPYAQQGQVHKSQVAFQPVFIAVGLLVQLSKRLFYK